MNALIVALVVLAVVALIALSLSVKVVTQYQRASCSGSAKWWVSRSRAWH
jgi:Tfp pilus assembly protein PilX